MREGDRAGDDDDDVVVREQEGSQEDEDEGRFDGEFVHSDLYIRLR